MPERSQRAWAELVQLVPVISLALPFLWMGEVDLSRAAAGFLVAALLTVPVTALVVFRRQLLNPILLGTAAWLWLGAAAFNLPLEAVGEWLSVTRAFGLFVAAFIAGALTSWLSPYGYVACRSSDPQWIRKASAVLLGLTAVAVIWAWVFRHDIRLGGGLPFIVLNVARRLITRRAPRPHAVAVG